MICRYPELFVGFAQASTVSAEPVGLVVEEFGTLIKLLLLAVQVDAPPEVGTDPVILPLLALTVESVVLVDAPLGPKCQTAA
jgi:hypothetical protein